MDFIALSFTIGLIFAIISAAIASKRGRSAPGWFLIGGLLGLIGLILVLVLPPLDNGPTRRPPTRPGYPENRDWRREPEKKCPYCAEWIKGAAIKCRYCGSDLSTTAPTPTQAEPTPRASGDVAELAIDVTEIPESGIVDTTRDRLGNAASIGHVRIDLGLRDLTRGTLQGVLDTSVIAVKEGRVERVSLVGVPGALWSYARMELKRSGVAMRQDRATMAITAADD